MGIFISDNPIREITDIHVGINNIARRCKKGWVGVDGVARLIFVDDTVDPTEIRRFGTYYETPNGEYSKSESHVCNSGASSNSEIYLDVRGEWVAPGSEWSKYSTSVIPDMDDVYAKFESPNTDYGSMYSLYIESSSIVAPKYGNVEIDSYHYRIFRHQTPTIEIINGKEYKKYRNISYVNINDETYDDYDTQGEWRGVSRTISVNNAFIYKFNSPYLPTAMNMANPDYVAKGWTVGALTQSNDGNMSITVQRIVKYSFLWQGTPPPASLWELSGVELVDSSDPTQGAFQIWRKR